MRKKDIDEEELDEKHIYKNKKRKRSTKKIDPKNWEWEEDQDFEEQKEK